MPTSEMATIRLLDVDPGLGARLREDDRAEARESVTVGSAIVPAGPWSPPDPHAPGHALGVLVLSGLLLDETQIDDHPSVRLLGPGDIALPRPATTESLATDVRWTVGADTSVAILDDRLQHPFTLWPGLALAFLDRVGDQLARAGVQKAITQMPRVEDRLEATLWDLADRWGRVTPAGVHLPLRLTHDLLARLVGGRRPTISLALGGLTERGAVARHKDGSWLLTGPAPSFARGAAPAAAHAAWVAVGEDVVRPVAEPPWAPSARDELAATVRRIGDAHHLAARRHLEDRQRYEETRRRSRSLRLAAARDRAARAGDGRSVTRLPAVPSAG